MPMNTAARHDPSAGRCVRLLPMLVAALLLVAGMVLSVSGLAGTAQGQAESGAIPSLTLDRNEPGQLVITWETADPKPTGYQLGWAHAGLDYLSHEDSNEEERASVYPAVGETTLTLDDLAPGEEYKVNLRARNTDGDHSDDPWSGRGHPPPPPGSGKTRLIRPPLTDLSLPSMSGGNSPYEAQST